MADTARIARVRRAQHGQKVLFSLSDVSADPVSGEHAESRVLVVDPIRPLGDRGNRVAGYLVEDDARLTDRAAELLGHRIDRVRDFVNASVLIIRSPSETHYVVGMGRCLKCCRSRRTATTIFQEFRKRSARAYFP